MTVPHHHDPSLQPAEFTRIVTGLYQRWLITAGGAQAAAVTDAGAHQMPGARWASVVLHRA